jgi:hypothetical protein
VCHGDGVDLRPRARRPRWCVRVFIILEEAFLNSSIQRLTSEKGDGEGARGPGRETASHTPLSRSFHCCTIQMSSAGPVAPDTPPASAGPSKPLRLGREGGSDGMRFGRVRGRGV